GFQSTIVYKDDYESETTHYKFLCLGNEKIATKVSDNFKPKFRVSFGPIATNMVEI
ncbi:5278_t:CDS:1, partial [Dentiscutata heterogama]